MSESHTPTIETILGQYSNGKALQLHESTKMVVAALYSLYNQSVDGQIYHIKIDKISQLMSALEGTFTECEKEVQITFTI